ncbi:MAG: M28 family peptidase [Clostridia bacterium]|nr:M28 family peptidase [Clostridia bacterium]
MNKIKRIINILLGVILCFFFVVSIVDTEETQKKTNFNQTNITTHIEKLSENGPRSIMDTEANQKALEYLITTVESYGITEGDTTEKPAYVIQDFVAEDTDHQNWYLSNLIVHIPANGTQKTGEAVMFMGHFDSVPMGQGSSDDGVSCSVMLEAIRYYLDKMQNGYTLSNDLLFAFVNGEEFGMYGSEAMAEEFTGFNNVIQRTKFVTNLESRGTSGTLIMFETGKNNYNTVKLFSEVNKNLFTCSIATMVYDMMPNNTDFTTFKAAYQGVNMANIGSGENYHTQNDSPDNIGMSYLSQQAQIVDGLIDKLGNYELSKLYDADESAIFFSYLNITTVVYNHTAVIVFAIIGIVMLAANILLSIFYRKENNVGKTAKAIGAIVVGLIIAAVVTYACYFLFQLIAALFGVIDIHMLGTITYSNIAIVIGIGILSLAITALTTHFACKWLKIERRDMTRAFAYIHVFLGIIVSFALPDASYLFMFSGIMLMINELLVTGLKKIDFAQYHGELLATALYLPIVIPVIFLATSALGMTMAYVYGLVFALTVFGVGICITPICEYSSVRTAIKASKNVIQEKKEVGRFEKVNVKVSAWEGALHILAVALVILFVVSVIPSNASVNLQGKQNNAKLPWDDALVYVVDENGDSEYRIYDLNAYRALKKYAPEMEYDTDHYVGDGEEKNIGVSILSTFEDNTLSVKKNEGKTIVYLTFTNETAESFTIDDGTTVKTYEFGENKTWGIAIHYDCTITVNGGSAKVEYKEVIRDYALLIPEEYANDDNKLHFNLWLMNSYLLRE